MKTQTNEILVMDKHQVTLEYNVDNEARASTSVDGQTFDPPAISNLRSSFLQPKLIKFRLNGIE